MRPSNYLIIGKRDTGKTTLVKDIVYNIRDSIDLDNSVIITYSKSDMDEYNCSYPEIKNKYNNGYKKEIISDLIKRQKESKDRKHVLLILDQCLIDESWENDEEMRYLFFNGRHIKTSIILTMQYPLGIKPSMRSNIDVVFILRDTNMKNRKLIYEYYAGMIPSFDLFCSIMNRCTENYECLVIHNNSKSNRFEDQVYWYKANLIREIK